MSVVLPLLLKGIAGAGVFSTAILNWVTSPYVIDMLLEDGKTVHLRTRSLFGTPDVEHSVRQHCAMRVSCRKNRQPVSLC